MTYNTILVLALLLAVPGALMGQAESISSARAKGPGVNVTVSGVVTNGDELGVIRYIQDQTGGLAIYDPTMMSGIVKGDSITVSGTLVDYNNLLEIQPVTSVSVEKQGAVQPDPVTLTPSQLNDDYEGMLVKIESAVFDEAGNTFSSKTNYDYTASGEIGELRIPSDESPFVGKVIPSGETDLVGILSQFYDTYQILVRLEDDIRPASSINFVSPPAISNLSTDGFTLSWETDIEGTTGMLYGNTPELELGKMEFPELGTLHEITISGAQPSQLIYIWPFSVNENDTAKAGSRVYITQSESSGEMLAFFNRPVDQSVSNGTPANFVDHAMEDTLIAYINRATESIDFSAYNFSNLGITSISDALNAAHARGVTVRVVYDINQANFGTDDLDGAIGKMPSPVSDYPIYGIMHNKFVVFDALSADPDLPIVWTGATNFTEGQLYVDPNNVVVIQDKSLAIAYQIEFNEMFGSEGAQPDAAASRFGPDKTDNTPHEFLVGGTKVESYFSPSDNTHTKILETLQSADSELHIATMLITKSDLAYAIRDRNEAGVDAQVLLKDEASSSELVINTLRDALSENLKISGEPGIMHHKYAIVDQGDAEADPIILTGSHNWSASAQDRNDENTLIIHDQDLAQQFYQEFVMRFRAGQLLVDAPVCVADYVTMTGGSSYRYDVTYNDEIPGPVTVEVSRQPTNGSAQAESDGSISYTPDPGFNTNLDTVYYKVSMQSNPNISDSSMMVVYVNLPVGMEDASMTQNFRCFPNPAMDVLHLEFAADASHEIELRSVSGRLLLRESSEGISGQLDLSALPDGVYFLRVISDQVSNTEKIIISR